MQAMALWALVLDAVLYGAIAVVISLTAREFRLFNLAAGVWVVVGGWLYSWMSSQGSNAASTFPIEAKWLFALALLGLIQIAIPWVLRGRLRRSPFCYLFSSLGIALIGTSVGIAHLLRTAGTTIPESTAKGDIRLVLFAGAVLICLIVALTQDSRWWARLVLSFRLESPQAGTWLKISLLIALEISLLLVLGGVGADIHKGIFLSVEYRSIIPILALVCVKQRPLRAGALASATAFLAGAVASLSPAHAEHGKILAIGALIVIALIRAWPENFRFSAHQLAVSGFPEKDARITVRGRQAITAGVVWLVLGGLWIAVALNFGQFLSTRDAAHHLVLIALTIAAWVGQSQLGLVTLIWPAIGTIAVYCSVWFSGDPLLFAAVLIFLTSSTLFYFSLLRILKEEPAMLVDLGLLVCLHQAFTTLPWLSGEEEVLIAAFQRMPFAVVGPAVLVIGVVLVALVLGMSWRNSFRAFSLALSNFRFGALNGAPILRMYTMIAFVLILASGACYFLYHSVSPALMVSQLSVEKGLAVFLLAYLMSRVHPVLGIIAGFVLFGLVSLLFSSYGSSFDIATGACLVLASFLFGEGSVKRP